jgi:hypothetical protein
MKIFFKILAILLIVAQANAAEICGSGKETWQQAVESLAMRINSNLSFHSKSEYESVYAKAKEACERPARGIYVESSNEFFRKIRLMKIACEKSVESSTTETWDKLKGKINLGGCK